MAIEITNRQSAAQSMPLRRAKWPAMLVGARHKCPSCGQGQLYKSYLKVVDTCGHCGEALHHHRADDAPPYFTIFIVGHIILGGVLSLEQAYKPSPMFHVMLWMPLTLILSLALLPRIKGALVGLQWALGMHGFQAGLERAPKRGLDGLEDAGSSDPALPRGQPDPRTSEL